MFVREAPLRFAGLEIGARMTAARLPDGTLWLHSPIGADPDTRAAVAELGEVAHLVAPNRFHHLFVGEWQAHCPAARTHVAPGLDTKRPDLGAARLRDAPDPGWAEVLDQVAVDGLPLINEVVFFHRPSATLIATDLAFNSGPSHPWFTRLFFRLSGAYGRLATTPLERLLTRDRPALRRSLERVLAWPFERVVVAHGEVLESGGRDALARAYRWLLKG